MISIIQHIFKTLIDVLYPPFKSFMPKQLFRYAFCGAFATGLDILIYFITYNYILEKENIYLAFITLKPHVAAVLIAFVISFPVGFFLQKYITFTNSNLRGRVQLFRYLLIVFVCILMNIYFIKFFVEILNWYPTPAKMITTVFVVTFSYFTQRYFSFKEK